MRVLGVLELPVLRRCVAVRVACVPERRVPDEAVGAGRILETAGELLTARERAGVDERLQVLLVDVPVADRDHDRADAQDHRQREREDDDDLAALSPAQREAPEAHVQTPALSAAILDLVAGCSRRMVAFAVSVIPIVSMKKNL